MSAEYSEDKLVQKTTAEFLHDELGWDVAVAHNTETLGAAGTFGRLTEREVVLTRDLRAALEKLNPGLPPTAYSQAVEMLTTQTAGKSIVAMNCEMHALVRDGVKVSYRDARGAMQNPTLRVIDFETPENNRFLAIRELWIQGAIYRRRPDILGFVNGLPLVFIELKKSTKDVRLAYENNYRDYRDTIPAVFHHNGVVLLSNGIQAKVGSITSKYGHFHEWKRLEEGDAGMVDWQTMLRGLCGKRQLLDLVENFILFDAGGTHGTVKIIARNHQFLGVNRAFAAVQERDVRKGKLGVFWHTQGSGKSYSMVFLTRKIHRKLSKSFTFVIVTDRTELDRQIAQTYAGCGVIGDAPQHRASSGAHLAALLKEGKSHVFTLIQKFNKDETYSTRNDIIVIADEAHRTQYGRLAENMRRSMPNASYFAFTGTPLIDSEEDQLTRRVFGDYVSTYDFKRAVDDQATVPLYYDNRGEKLGIATTDLNDRVASALEGITLDQDETEKLRRELAREYPILTAPERLDRIADDFVAHYSERWQTGKAMIVCLDKITCVKMYELITERWQVATNHYEALVAAAQDEQAQREAEDRAQWMRRTQFRVIVSEEQGEVGKFENWARVENDGFAARGLDRRWSFSITEHREVMKTRDCEEEFKNEDHPFRVAIVCAMWLTGFDVPSLSTLYLDKPMKGHTLMQAIARANRVNEGKNNGLLVDYNGMLASLRAALAKYGMGGHGGSGGDGKLPEPDIAALLRTYVEALDAAVAHVDACGFQLRKLIEAKGFDKLALLDKDKADSAVNAVCQTDQTRAEFEIRARDVFKKKRALAGSEEVLRPHRPKFNAIEAIYSQLQDNREAADITHVIVRLYGVVGDHIRVTLDGPAGADRGKLFDISAIDFERLRKEFEKSKTKNRAVQDIKGGIERKLRKMIDQNPLRIDLYAQYMKIIEAYNRETDRATIEQTFQALLAFLGELGTEEQRVVREGLSEEQAAVFDLLVRSKGNLPKASRERVKRVAGALLGTVKEKLAQLHDWRSMGQTQAIVKTLIHDFLYDEKTGLPEEFEPEEIEALSNVVFLHVHSQYRSATDHPYVASAA
jgi:type I restriction enzyme R subunit